jgi:hypothetical protein
MCMGLKIPYILRENNRQLLTPQVKTRQGFPLPLQRLKPETMFRLKTVRLVVLYFQVQQIDTLSSVQVVD